MNFYSTVEGFKKMCGYTINDIWFPRVTKILEIKAKPALYRYYGDLNSYAEGEVFLKNSATEGTMIHEAVEKIMVGESPIIDPSIAPAVRAFTDFIEKKKIQVDKAWVEKQVVHYNERYAGTIDSLALIDGKFGVLDIKTSKAIYRDYNLQTAAYMGVLQDEFKNLQTRWILRIDQTRSCMKCRATLRQKGGRDKVTAYGAKAKACDHEWNDTQGSIELQEMPYWKNDFEAFLSAKKLWEWENEDWLKKAGYLS